MNRNLNGLKIFILLLATAPMNHAMWRMWGMWGNPPSSTIKKVGSSPQRSEGHFAGADNAEYKSVPENSYSDEYTPESSYSDNNITYQRMPIFANEAIQQQVVPESRDHGDSFISSGDFFSDEERRPLLKKSANEAIQKHALDTHQQVVPENPDHDSLISSIDHVDHGDSFISSGDFFSDEERRPALKKSANAAIQQQVAPENSYSDEYFAVVDDNQNITYERMPIPENAAIQQQVVPENPDHDSFDLFHDETPFLKNIKDYIQR